jgi:hypothetical protein
VRNILQPQLIHHIGPVCLYRLDADHQLVGDLLVRSPLSDKGQHFQFTRRQDPQFLLQTLF